MSLVIWRECDNCGSTEERVLTDSWSGKELCVECLISILPRLALSPQSEYGDNLDDLLEGVGE